MIRFAWSQNHCAYYFDVYKKCCGYFGLQRGGRNIWQTHVRFGMLLFVDFLCHSFDRCLLVSSPHFISTKWLMLFPEWKKWVGFQDSDCHIFFLFSSSRCHVLFHSCGIDNRRPLWYWAERSSIISCYWKMSGLSRSGNDIVARIISNISSERIKFECTQCFCSSWNQVSLQIR